MTVLATVEERPVTTGQVPALLEMIGRLATDPATDVSKFRELLQLQREVIADEAKAAFNSAMAHLQPRLPRIKKNGEVTFEQPKGSGNFVVAFKYARWEDVDTAIRGILNEEGFSLSFNTKQRVGEGGGVVVIGKLLHIAGHSETAEFPLPLDTSGGKSNLQGMASSTSFGQRYTTKMLLNLIFEGEDTDGVGPPPTITPDQAGQIAKKIDEVGANLEAFLNYMSSPSIALIPALRFDAAMAALDMKRKQK